VLGVLGKGSFGQVLKVLDYKTGQYMALKIIRNKRRFHHQAQVRSPPAPCLPRARILRDQRRSHHQAHR